MTRSLNILFEFFSTGLAELKLANDQTESQTILDNPHIVEFYEKTKDIINQNTFRLEHKIVSNIFNKIKVVLKVSNMLKKNDLVKQIFVPFKLIKD